MNFVAAAVLDHLLGRRGRVDVDHADHVVASLHRHANRLADARLNNAGRRVPAVVLPGVAGQHALVALHHVVENRLADRDLLVGRLLRRLRRRRVRRTLGSSFFVSGSTSMMQPRSASTHSKIRSMIRCKQLVDVQRVADRQGRAVHHLQVAPRPGEPGILRPTGAEFERPGAVFLGDRMDDLRTIADCWGRAMSIDWARSSADSSEGRRVEHQGAAELDLVAARKGMGLDPLAIDVGAVGAAEVGEKCKYAVRSADFGVVARDFGVVQPDGAGGVASDSRERLVELETRALVVSPDDKQRRHGDGSP